MLRFGNDRWAVRLCASTWSSAGPECRHTYAINPIEYFAELSVVFIGGLDDTLEHSKWFPFNRSQLREHDPREFDLLCRMWGAVAVRRRGSEWLSNSQ